MDSGPILVAALLVLVSGGGWLALLGARPSSGPERLGLAFACGAAWLGLLALLLSPLELFQPVVVLPLLFLPALGVLRGKGAGRASWLSGWGGFALVVPIVALSFWFAAQRPVYSIDAQRRWVLHAQWTAHEHSATPERIESQEWAAAHPAYPPLVPALLALGLEFGANRDMGLRAAGPVYLLALLGVVFGFASRRAPPFGAALLTGALATVPAMALLDSAEGAWGLGADPVLADVPLALFLTAFLLLVLDALDATSSDRDAAPYWRLAVLIGAGSVLTKNEGMAYTPVAALIGLVLVFLAGKESAFVRARPPMLVVFVAAIATAAAWKFVARNMPVRIGERYLSTSVVDSLVGGVDRFGDVSMAVGESLADVQVWGWLWAIPLLWLVWFAVEFKGLTGEERLRRLLPFVWLGLALSMVLVAYLTTGWRGGNWRRLMDVSLARLLIHHVPLALILLVDLFGRPADRAAPQAESSPA